MSNLKIMLLGTPEAYHDEQRLFFPDRKTLALLAYLATENGLHKRQKLANLLWPESDRAHGRTALRITLHHLRRVLSEETHAEHEAHLTITHDVLGLHMDANISLDLLELEAAWKLVQTFPAWEAMQGETRRALIVQFQHAVTLYRGGFLEEWALRDTVSFDNWVSVQRQYWYQRADRVFDCLSQLQSMEGMVEQAIETAERWRSFDPLNEDISRRLMQLHFAAGSRIEALRIYKAYSDLLQAELSAKPSPKLVALARSIRHTSSPGRSQHSPPGEQRASSARTLFNIPFVGRAAEFSRLMSFYELASSGQPQVVLIEGEAGIGKSRLAAAFLDWARTQGAAVLSGKAYKTSRRMSYQPLLDSLHTWIEREPDLHHFLSDTWQAELSRLFPELRERYPHLPSPTVDTTFASARLLEALTRLSQAYAAQMPLLIFIDDIQWTDDATFDAFHYLAKRWLECAMPALLLLVRRTETRSTDTWLAEGLLNLKNTAPLTRMQLGPLSAKDILQMVHSFSDADEEPVIDLRKPPSLGELSHGLKSTLRKHFGEWLFAEAGGQPFYTVAMLEALLERGDLVPRLIEGKGWIFELQSALFGVNRPRDILPLNVREMIQNRLAGLAPTTRELLAAGAVLDHDFLFDDLCQVARLSTQDGLAALDEAMETLLLRESSRKSRKGSRTMYTFVHDKIREVIYAEAGDARRRVFHERALQALERAGARAAEMAYHAIASGATDVACCWSIMAGDEAMKISAIRDAIGHYEQARQLIAEHSMPVSQETLAHLFTRLGHAYEHCNNSQAAQATYQAMLGQARDNQDPVMECAALNLLAVLVSEDFSRLDQAMTWLQEALAVAESTGNRVSLAQTQWSLARVYYYILNLDASLVHGKQAYTLARELEHQEFITKSLNILAYTTRALGQWEEAAAIAEEARQHSVARGDRMMEADCLSRIADARINCGQPREGLIAARAAYRISQEVEHPWGQANSGYQLARCLVEMGAYEEALEIAFQSTRIAQTLTFNVLLFVNLLTLGLVYEALLLPEKALQAHLEGLEVSKRVPSPRYLALSMSLVCVDYALAGNWETASSYARQVLEIGDPRVVVCPEIARWPETEALVRIGLDTRAADALSAFYERFNTNRRCRLIYLRAQAVLARSQGAYDQAQAYLQEAITCAHAIELPGELWQAEAALGELYLLQKKHAQATETFSRAAVVVEKLAGAISSDELRSCFLASPQVQRIFKQRKKETFG